jgi:hypothetical protein
MDNILDLSKLGEKKKRALYLDDIRIPTKTIEGYEPWYVVKSYDEFTAWITANGVPDYISFDHDLGDEHYVDYVTYQAQGIAAINYEDFKEKTGFDCAKWLCEHIQDNGLILHACSVHSFNPMGALNIKNLINNFKTHMGWIPDCFLGKPEFRMPGDPVWSSPLPNGDTGVPPIAL